MSIVCIDVARREFRLSSLCSVGMVISCSCWDSCGEIIGTLSGVKICGVSRSVCIVPRSVGYIRKSSVETWQADALISSPASTSACVWGTGFVPRAAYSQLPWRREEIYPDVPVLYHR